MASSRPDKLVVDSVHGDIQLRPDEWEVVDTASFQRLRHLKQLQLAHLTYPNATHTRFAHSIGVLGIMARIAQIAQRQGLFDADQLRDIRLAGLLHDVGHYPYSHLMESIDQVKLTEEVIEGSGTVVAASSPYPEHEELGEAIVSEQKDLLAALGGPDHARHIARLFRRDETADAQLSKLIHSSLDMDRLDYLVRDGRAAGVPFGEVDLHYLINNFRISPKGTLGIRAKAVTAVDHFLLARVFMFRSVYWHKTTFGFEEACRQLLCRVRGRGTYDLPRDGDQVRDLVTGPHLGQFTDAFVDRVVEEAAADPDPVIAALANSIRRRRPPRLLKEVVILADGQGPHAGTRFKSNCRNGLKALADRAGLHPGRLLITQTRPLRLEKRGASSGEGQARAMQAEEREEIIKVFVEGQEEPVSIVDVPHSLTHLWAEHFFQAFRLYLVPDDATDEGLVERLRGEVSGWDRG
jgi:uncharacterized protein